MRNKLILHFFILVLLSFGLNAQNEDIYVRTMDFTGIDSSLYLEELNTAAEYLSEKLPSEFKSNFKVFDNSPYFHSRSFDEDLDLTFENMVNSSKSETNNFLIICRTLGENIASGQELYIKLVLDENFYSSCIDANYLVLLNDKIRLKFLDLYSKDRTFLAKIYLQEDIIQFIANTIEARISCCQSTSDNTCQEGVFSENQILQHFYEYGYVGYPISVLNINTLKLGGVTSRNQSVDIVNCSTSEFSIGAIDNCNIEANLGLFFNDVPQEESIKLYITDNACFESSYNTIIEDFQSNEYDFAAHFHVFDSNQDEIPDIILFYDFSSTNAAWCEDLETFNPELYYYSLFDFAGVLEKPGDSVIPDNPGVWRKVWKTVTGNGHVLKAERLANERSIPSDQIYIYHISPDKSLLSEAVDFFNPLPFYIQEDIAFAILYEEADLDEKLHLFSDISSFSQFSKDYIGSDYSTKPFNCGNAIDADWTLYFSEGENPEPILDQDWVKAYLDCLLPKTPDNLVINTFGKKAIAKRIKKAATKVKKNGTYNIYFYRVGNLFYFGLTRQQWTKRIAQHAKAANINLSESGRLFNNVPNKLTARGLEQVIIEFGRLKYGDDLLNAINSISPKRRKVMKNAIDKAYKWASENGKKNFDKFDFDDMIDIIYEKYDLFNL